MELTMFERLLQFPTFQGLTTMELSDVMSHVRLDFVNYHAGDEIVMQGDNCRNLIYLINGEVAAEYRDSDSRFTMYEELPNLKVLEPYNMFGMYQKYSRTYLLTTDGTTLTIDRKALLERLMNNNIVRINLLNIACNRYQQTQRLLSEQPDNTVREKIVKFLLTYSSAPKGKKNISMKMQTLADIIHETRLNVSNTLNTMQKEGLVELQRGGFSIAEMQNLYRRWS